jgi:ABC-type amino acid transport substrate-binding protein
MPGRALQASVPGFWTWLRGLVLLGLAAVAACDLPHDPNDTLERVQKGVMRVGAIEAEPWVRWSELGPSGIEVALIEEFAGELDARVEWIRGGESQVLLALSEERIDLAIGGLTKSNPWSDEVAFTRPYHRSHLSITARPAADSARLVTVPQQKLEGRLEQSPLVSQEFEHVMAVPNGENAWLLRLETFLMSRKNRVSGMLDEAPS